MLIVDSMLERQTHTLIVVRQTHSKMTCIKMGGPVGGQAVPIVQKGQVANGKCKLNKQVVVGVGQGEAHSTPADPYRDL